MSEALLSALRRELPGLEARQEEPLRNYTSFGIGGPARAHFCARRRSLRRRKRFPASNSRTGSPARSGAERS